MRTRAWPFMIAAGYGALLLNMVHFEVALALVPSPFLREFLWVLFLQAP